MLYHILPPLTPWFPVLNVTRYITFRTAAASLTALAIGLFLGPWMIRKLREFQIGQVIRQEGPATHRAKAGTPTMGGLLILTAAFVRWRRDDRRVFALGVTGAVFAVLSLGRVLVVHEHSAGLPLPWFALGRLPGWIAHWREMINDPTTKIGRPRQVYTGATERPYVSMGDR